LIEINAPQPFADDQGAQSKGPDEKRAAEVNQRPAKSSSSAPACPLNIIGSPIAASQIVEGVQPTTCSAGAPVPLYAGPCPGMAR
jgi:hypothetical protein